MPAPASATSLRAGNRLGRVRHIADHNSTFACISLKTSGGVCLHPSFLLAAVLLLHRVGSSGHVRSSPAAHHRSPKVTIRVSDFIAGTIARGSPGAAV